MIRRFPRATEESMRALREFWDARVSGDEPSKGLASTLDISFKDTVDRLHREDHAPTASDEFNKMLFSRLMNAVDSMADQSEYVPHVAGERIAPHPPYLKPALPLAQRQSAMVGKRVAWAIVVLTVLLAVGAGVAIWQAGSEDAHQIVPLRTEVTANGVVVRTLVEEQVEGGMLPGDPTKWIASVKYSLQPGEHWRDAPIGCEMARQYVVGLVESGTLAFTDTGSFEIHRSDGSTEVVAAGTRANVHAGDIWVYFADRTETNLNKWNPGSEPLVAVETNWALDNSCEGVPVNPDWLWAGSKTNIRFDDTRPVVARIEQIMVEPGATISHEDAARLGLSLNETGIFSVFGIESGSLRVVTVAGALESQQIGQQAAIYDETLVAGESWIPQSALPLREGEEWVFANASNQLLIMTVAGWSYDGVREEEAATPLPESEELDRKMLVDLEFPADLLSRDESSRLVLNRAVVPPGETVHVPESCGVPAMLVTYVEAGSYEIVAEGTLEVTRAGGSTKSVASRQQVELRAGDVFRYVNTSGDRLEGFRNGGTAPLSIVQAIWFTEETCSFGRPGSSDRKQITWVTSDRLPSLQHAPAFELQVSQMTMKGFGAFTAEALIGFSQPVIPMDNLAVLIVESGTVTDEFLMVTGSQRERIFSERFRANSILKLDESPASGANIERTLSSLGTQSAEILVISITYVQDVGSQDG